MTDSAHPWTTTRRVWAASCETVDNAVTNLGWDLSALRQEPRAVVRSEKPILCRRVAHEGGRDNGVRGSLAAQKQRGSGGSAAAR